MTVIDLDEDTFAREMLVLATLRDRFTDFGRMLDAQWAALNAQELTLLERLSEESDEIVVDLLRMQAGMAASHVRIATAGGPRADALREGVLAIQTKAGSAQMATKMLTDRLLTHHARTARELVRLEHPGSVLTAPWQGPHHHIPRVDIQG